jgi:sec-independent protein translocase protein TatB
MNIFGFGPLEIMLIAVIALIVFGPAKLPEIMGNIGRAIAEFRKVTGELSSEFNRTIQAEIDQTRAVVDSTRSVVDSAVAPPRAATPASVPEPVGAAVAANGVGATAAPAASAATSSPSTWSWETATPKPPTPPAAPSAPAPAPPDDLLPPY